MAFSLEVLDLTKAGIPDAENLHDKWDQDEIGLSLIISESLKDTIVNVKAGKVAVLVIKADSYDKNLQILLEAFLNSLGAFGDHIAIINTDPSPELMADVYEFGVETFFPEEGWISEAKNFASEISSNLNEEDSSFMHSLNMLTAIAKKDTESVTVINEKLKEATEWDFRAAFASGKGHEALGDHKAAIEAFAAGKKLNKNYRPITSDLANNLIRDGQPEAALPLLEQLERTNPDNTNRKSQLIKAYIKNNDIDKAQEKLEEFRSARPDIQEVDEIQADIYLAKGDLDSAVHLLDQMKDVGNEFAAVLNEHGVNLAKAGKGKSALLLYQKAHDIVRQDLKYKISLNASLACYRLKAYKTALKFIERSEQEFGKKYPKSIKIKQKILHAQKQDQLKNAS